MTEPKVFISYSWEGEEHKSWVRGLGEELQRNGVKVFLDQWDAHLGIDLPNYMETSIRDADHVLLICTPNFAKKADLVKGGVGYEKMIVTGEIFLGSASPKKFVPLIRIGSPDEALPSYLKSKLYVDFRNDSDFENSIEELLRHFHGSPAYSAPSIGPKPSFTNKNDPNVKSNSRIYCSNCGMVPGAKTTCIGGSAHNLLSYTGTVYCSKCSKKPGEYSTCIGAEPHNLLSYTGTVYCSKCGKKPGEYSTCIGGEPHNLSSYAGTIYCSRCGKTPGVYSTCIGGLHHDYRVFK